MIVADVNLIAYYLLKGEFTADAEAARLRDGDWVAPRMWADEFLNVLATNVRTGKLDYSVATEAWALAQEIVAAPPPVEIGPIDVMDLSVQSHVATYDCTYVQLARVLGTRLVTNDKKVLSRFSDVAVSIRDFAAGQ